MLEPVRNYSRVREKLMAGMDEVHEKLIKNTSPLISH